MLCFGPVCVPVWQVGVIFALLLGPLKTIAAYVYDTCSRRRRWVNENEEAPSFNGLLLHRGAGGCPVYEEVKRRVTKKEFRVLHIRSDEDMKNFWKEIQGRGDAKVFADFSAQWCGPCRAISPFYETSGANARKWEEFVAGHTVPRSSNTTSGSSSSSSSVGSSSSSGSGSSSSGSSGS